MLKQAAIVLSLLVVASPAVAREFEPGKPVSRWSIKTSLVSGADLTHAKTVAIADLIALQDANGVTKADSRYTTKRIPGATGGLHEGDIIRTKGYVHVVALDGDGDYHIQVTDSPTSGNNCFIVELPKDDPAFEGNAKLRALCADRRAYLRQELLQKTSTAKEFTDGGNWMRSQVYMSITGQLFFDDWHVGGEPRGRSPQNHAGHAATLWELHPVTDIRFTKKPN